MAHLTYPITHIDENKVSISLSKSLYSPEAIHALAYKFSDKFFIVLDEDGDKFTVMFETKDGVNIEDSTIKFICNDLIDQQIRIETEKQFGHIRDLIVEEAFKPVTKKYFKG